MAATLRTGAAFDGVGLHGGQSVAMRVLPAPAGHGVLFRRTDLPAGRGDIPARWNNVVDTKLCTRLGNAHGASVGTIEHVMAALAGCGVAGALIVGRLDAHRGGHGLTNALLAALFSSRRTSGGGKRSVLASGSAA